MENLPEDCIRHIIYFIPKTQLSILKKVNSIFNKSISNIINKIESLKCNLNYIKLIHKNEKDNNYTNTKYNILRPCINSLCGYSIIWKEHKNYLIKLSKNIYIITKSEELFNKKIFAIGPPSKSRPTYYHQDIYIPYCEECITNNKRLLQNYTTHTK